MSKNNGDRAKFNKERKRKIARRLKMRTLVADFKDLKAEAAKVAAA